MESDQRPLTHVRYQSANSNPYGAGDPYYNQSSGYLPPQKPKKGVSNWIKIGVPVLILVIIGVVVGVVVGVKKHNDDNAAASSNNPSAAASSAINEKNSVGRFPTATDTNYFMPIYPSTVRSRLSFAVLFLTVAITDEYCGIYDSNVC